MFHCHLFDVDNPAIINNSKEIILYFEIINTPLYSISLKDNVAYNFI